jgi:hypothetical protein
LWADFEDSPATHNFLADCTTLACHRAVKAIMSKTLYRTVAILPSAVAQITHADMFKYLTMAQLVFQVGSTGRTLLGRLMGPLYCRLHPTPVLPWLTTTAGYRGVFLDRGYSTSLASCLPGHPWSSSTTRTTWCHCGPLLRDPCHRYSVLVGTHHAARRCGPRLG